jgi:ribosomal protein L24E
MAICSWCVKEYQDGKALYHVCDDGTTFEQRLKKTAGEREREWTRRAAILREAKEKNYDVLPLTPDDMDFLNAMKIKL